MVEKIKTDIDKLLLVLTMNKIFPIYHLDQKVLALVTVYMFDVDAIRKLQEQIQDYGHTSVHFSRIAVGIAADLY